MAIRVKHGPSAALVAQAGYAAGMAEGQRFYDQLDQQRRLRFDENAYLNQRLMTQIGASQRAQEFDAGERRFQAGLGYQNAIDRDVLRYGYGLQSQAADNQARFDLSRMDYAQRRALAEMGYVAQADRDQFQAMMEQQRAAEAYDRQRQLEADRYGYQEAGNATAFGRQLTRDDIQNRQQRERDLFIDERDAARQERTFGYGEQSADAAMERQRLMNRETRDFQREREEFAADNTWAGKLFDAEKARQSQEMGILGSLAGQAMGERGVQRRFDSGMDWNREQFNANRQDEVDKDWRQFQIGQMEEDAGFDREWQKAQLAADYHRAQIEQQQIEAEVKEGLRRYTPAQKNKLAKLDQDEFEIASDPNYDDQQRTQALRQIAQQRAAIKPAVVPVDERPVPINEKIGSNLFVDKEGVFGAKGLPWTVDPKTGMPEIPKGYPIPDPMAEAPEDKRQAEWQKSMMGSAAKMWTDAIAAGKGADAEGNETFDWDRVEQAFTRGMSKLQQFGPQQQQQSMRPVDDQQRKMLAAKTLLLRAEDALARDPQALANDPQAAQLVEEAWQFLHQAGIDPSQIPQGARDALRRGGKSSNWNREVPGWNGNGPVQIKTDADWEALPPGTEYIDPNGKRRRKG